MRQAGRYLPEYRELRARAGSFKQLYRRHATEISLMPLKRYELDAAIIFSDILIALDAIGMEVNFDDRGPVLTQPLRGADDLSRLRNSVAEEAYDYLARSLREVRAELPPQIPVIGFVGSPWTLAVYSIEGSIVKDPKRARRMLYQDPQLLHSLLALLTKEATQLVRLQAQSGADIIQIFDSWAGLLPCHLYQQFSLNYIAQIIEATRIKQPIILFARECPLGLPALMETGVTALSLDWKTDIARAFKQVGSKTILQGNLDPTALYGDIDLLEKEVRRILAARPPRCGHIFNLGHGILPDVDPHRVAQLIELVHRLDGN